MAAFETVVAQPIARAERDVRHALQQEGFGILTEIDVAATLEATLGVDRPALKILGACNPTIAERALDANPGVALLLPCNVVLEEAGPGRTRVAIVDPRSLLAVGVTAANADLEALGAHAATLLERALDRLAG